MPQYNSQATPTQKVIKVKILADSDENSDVFFFETVEEFENYSHWSFKPGTCFYGAGFYTEGKCCPEYRANDILYVFWNKTQWVDINIDGRKIFEGIGQDDGCGESCGTVERANYSIAGIKGTKGDMGIGTKGAKSEKGDPGEKAEKGDPGDDGSYCDKGNKGEEASKGAKSAKGDDGEKGSKGVPGTATAKGEKGQPGVNGEDGDNVDLGGSAIVRLDGVNYGARLMGVCVNGQWKYVYVFASTPF